MTIVDTVMNGAAGAAILFLTTQAVLIHRDRKAMKRTRRWYVDLANQLAATSDTGTVPASVQMCGGCGVFLFEEEIAICQGQKCERYLRPQNNVLEQIHP